VVEQLEGRSLPAVVATIDAAGLLRVASDADDCHRVSAVGSDVRINGAVPNTGPFASANVVGLEIVCTSPVGGNGIDLHESSRLSFLLSHASPWMAAEATTGWPTGL